MSRIGDAEVFVEVVDKGGFTAAARALGLSQPAVSRRITALEARLGVRLLARSTRALRTTDAGRLFYERCRLALIELVEAESEATAHGTDLRGSLRLTAPPAFARAVLLPHLAAFSVAHPGLVIDLRTGERYVDLSHESYDLAIRIGDPGQSSGLIRTRLTEFHSIACAAPSYLEANGTPRSPSALEQHACLVQAAQAPRDVWTFTPRRRTDRPEVLRAKVTGSFRSNDVESLAIAARGGLGITLLPDYLIAADLEQGTLRRILPGYDTREVEVWAVYAERRHLPRRVRVLLDFLIPRLRRSTR